MYLQFCGEAWLNVAPRRTAAGSLAALLRFLKWPPEGSAWLPVTGTPPTPTVELNLSQDILTNLENFINNHLFAFILQFLCNLTKFPTSNHWKMSLVTPSDTKMMNN